MKNIMAMVLFAMVALVSVAKADDDATGPIIAIVISCICAIAACVGGAIAYKMMCGSSKKNEPSANDIPNKDKVCEKCKACDGECKGCAQKCKQCGKICGKEEA